MGAMEGQEIERQRDGLSQNRCRGESRKRLRRRGALGIRMVISSVSTLMVALMLVALPAYSSALDCIAGETLQGNTCVPCAAGTFKAASGNQTCTPCTTGASSAGSAISCYCIEGYTGTGSTCTSCAAGTYKPNPGSSACTLCLANTYSATVGATASVVCTTCGPDAASPAGSQSLAACTCNSGYTGTAPTCGACPSGTYKSTTGSAACTSCGANTYSTTLAATASSTCLSCDANAVSPLGSGSGTMCACNAGYTGTGVSCSLCAAGSYKLTSGNESCTLCPADTYCTGGLAAPVSCPLNALAPVGSTSYAACYCVDGYSWYQGGTICIPCVENTYCKSGTLSNCPTNSASPAVSSVNTSCKCNTGYSGQDGGTCAVCAAGSYKDTTGSAQCTLCSAGTYSDFVGADQASFCLPCSPNSNSGAGSTAATSCTCNVGYSGADGGPCLICQAGLYKELPGNLACTQCGAGSYSAATGATASTTCTACPANSITPLGAIYSFQCSCQVGYTGTPGSCTACTQGKYKDVTGTAACAKCPTGTYLTVTGATSAAACTACPPNTNSASGSTTLTDCKCNVGYTGPDGGACNACAAGEYKETSGNAGCTPCGPASYGATTGRTACVNCPDANQDSPLGSTAITACKCNDGYNGPNGGTCVACAAGTYWTYGTLQGVCNNCMIGKYHYEIAVVGDQCFTCPASTNTPMAATNAITGCVCNAGYTGPDGKACVACPAGTYKVATGSAACTNCAANTYSTQINATSVSVCTACDANARSLAGSYEAAACTCNQGYTGPDGGACTICGAGTYKPSYGPYSCKQCQAGKYSTAIGAVSEVTCAACAPNSDSPAGASAASQCTCNVGYYKSAGTCTGCAVGTYKAAQGDQACTSCQTHASTVASGALALEQCICNDGYYGALGGTCSPCPANSYCAGGQANSCPWYTVSNSLSSLITHCTCQAGYYSTQPDGTMCQLCPRNSYCTGGVAISSCPGATPISPFGSTSSGECVASGGGGGGGSCLSGTYLSGSSCVQCPANSYCPGGSSAPSVCLENSYSVAGMPSAAACVCNAGYYGVPGSTCTPCTANSYCNFGRKYPCPLNAVSSTLQSAVGSCSCPNAYAGAAGKVCVPCQAGSWCASGTETVCVVETDSPYMSSTIGSCLCDPGWTGPDGGSCVGCANGKYKTAAGSSTCDLCPSGKWSWLTEADTDVTCVVCPIYSTSSAGSYAITQCTCNAGYTGSDGGPCKGCVAGTWKSAQGAVVCTLCSAGTYSATVSATSVSACLACPTNSNSGAGADALVKCTCNAGSTGPDGSACSLCIAGTYKTSQGSMECTQCAVDTFSTATGQNSASTCLACPVNTTSPRGSSISTQCVCTAGHTGPNGGPCPSCPAGYFKSQTGTASCVVCGAGKYSNDASSKCSNCPANSYSVPPGAGSGACKCNAGYTGQDGGTCTICPAGTYKSTTGSAACTPCPAGTWAFPSDVGSTSFSQCNACAQSSYSASQSVLYTSCKCNAGYTGQDGAPCPPCPSGSYKDASGSAACTGCSAGTYSTTVSATVPATCLACHGNSTSNYYSGQQTDCRCVAGHTGADGGPSCPDCAAGSWKSWVGGQSCQLCKAGQYSATLGAESTTVCLTCPSNTYSSAGSGSLNGCTANRGYYMSGSSAFYTSPVHSSPTPCVVGTYKPEMQNNSWCSPCFEGSTTIATGSISVSQCICDIGRTRSGSACPACVAGKYKTIVGPTACPSCPSFTTSVEGAVRLVDCKCLAGYFGADGTACTACGKGVYKDVIGNSSCVNCPVNTYSTSTAAVSIATCSACDTNAQSPTGSQAATACLCNVGYSGANGAACSSCSGGKYKSSVGSAACSNCAVGTYSGATAATSISTCTTCPALKTTSASGKSLLTDCMCVTGYTGANGAANCTACAAGSYKDVIGPASCSLCPAGTYSGSIGLTSSSQCTNCPANFWSLAGITTVGDCWQILFTTASVGQTQPLARGSNTLIVTLYTNLNFPASLSTGVTISGFSGVSSGTSVTLSSVSGGNNAQTVFGGSGVWSSGTLTLTIASGQTLNGFTNYIFAFSVTNGASAQSAPAISIKANGRISTAQAAMTFATPSVISGVTNGSAPLLIVVPSFDLGTVRQSMPLASGSNTLTISLRCTVAVSAASLITITGLTDSLTASTSSLPVSSTPPNIFNAVGVWTASPGTLVVTVATAMTAATPYILVFSIRNPALAKSAVTVTASGMIETGASDAPVGSLSLTPENFSILSVASGSRPLTVVQPAFTTKLIAQSYPVADASTVITVTFQANCDMPAASFVTVVGLTGSQTPNVPGAGSITLSSTPASFSAVTWTQSSGTLVMTNQEALNTSVQAYVVSFTVRNPTTAHSSPVAALTGTMETGTFDSPFSQAILAKPGLTIIGVAGGSDPLYCVVPTFTTRIVTQSEPRAFKSNNITVTLQANVNLAHSDGSKITLSGFTDMTAPEGYVQLNSFSINGTASTSIFSTGSAVGYGMYAGGNLTLALAPGQTLSTGLWYSFYFTVTNPDHIQPAPNVTVAATGTAPFLRDTVYGSAEALLGQEGGALPARIVCPSGYYAPAGNPNAQCLPCWVGSFSLAVGTMDSSTCTTCPDYTNSGAASDELTDCTCNKGYTGPNGLACTACPTGQYKDVQGSAFCMLCAADTWLGYSAAIAPSNCSSCSPNSQSPEGSSLITACQCNAGWTGNLGGPCTACIAGTYKLLKGSASCVNCPADTYSVTVNATTAGTCLACPANSVSPAGSDDVTDCQCNPGYTGPNGGPCVQCAAGLWKSWIGPEACSTCPEGTYSGATGLTNYTQCTDCPANFWSGWGKTLVADCWEIFFTTADIGQSQPLAGGANSLTFTLATNVDIPSSKSTGVTISGLSGAIAASSVALNAVAGGNSADVLFGSSATFATGSHMVLRIASGQRLLNGTAYIFSVDIQNPPGAQAMPSIFINSTGRISSALNQTRVGSSTTIRGVASGSLPLLIYVPRIDDRTVWQSIPLTSASNTLTMTLTPNCDFSAASLITVYGLLNTLSANTASLGVTSTGSVLASVGTWTGSTGSLVMSVVSTMSGGTQYTVSFAIVNPSEEQSTASPMASGQVETGAFDAPIAAQKLIPEVFPVLGVVNGSLPLQVVKARFTVNSIGHSYPVANANTVVSVTLQCNVDMPAGSLVTVSGLTGSQQADSLGLGDSSDLILYSNVGFSAFHQRPVWTKSTGTLVFRSKALLPTQTQAYVVWFTLINPVSGQTAPTVSLSGQMESGSYDAPVSPAQLVQPNTKIYGVAGGGNPLYSIVPTFTTRHVRQSNPLAFATSNITISLTCNVELSQTESSVITITGLNDLAGGGSSVQLRDFTTGGNLTASIFTDGANLGYAYLSPGGSLTLTLAPGQTMSTGVVYSFWFAVVNPSHIQPAPTVKISASGTAPYLPATVTLDNTAVLGTVGWAYPGTIVCPKGYYAPASGGVNATCTKCPAGTFSAAVGTMKIETCTACPANTNSNMGVTLITDCSCNRGYTGPGSTLCTACPAGQYKDTQGPAACSFCSRTMYSTTIAAITSATCSLCPANTDAPVGSGKLSSCICNSGYTGSDGMTCNACPAGTFKPANGSAPCSKCAPGTYSGAIAAVDSATCVTCPVGSSSDEASSLVTHCTCLLGYTAPSNGLACTACPAGMFKPTRGTAACTACASGKYSEGSAAFDISTCLTCPSNTYAPASSGLLTKCTCNAGYTGADGTACVACPTGSYKSFTGAGVCTECSAGKYSAEPAAVSQTYCKSCAQYANSPSGSSSISACICQVGYYGPSLGPCVPCERGSWCALGRRNTCSANSDAPAQSTSQSSCTCNAGFSPPVADGPCTPCSSNKYKETWDNATCTTCPANSESERVGSDSHFLCGCKPGYYGPLGGSCTQCEAGFYCARGVKVACPAFTTSIPGSTGATACHAMPSYTCNSGEACNLCPLDRYCPGGPQPNVFACPVGTQAPQGMFSSSSCVTPANECSDANAERSFGGACSCRRGYYGDVPAGQSCSLCPQGFYCPGGNTRLSCQAYSSSANGSSFSANCICNPGYALSGSSCVQCVAGKWCYSGAINDCPQNTNSAAGSKSASDCAPLRGYCGQPGYPYRPGAKGTYCDADGTIRNCPEPATDSPTMSFTVQNCTLPPGVSVSAGTTANATNTTQDRVTSSSCGTGACPVGKYRTACFDGAGGGCVDCTKAGTLSLDANAMWTTAGDPFDQDKCGWACKANYVLNPEGKCALGGSSTDKTDMKVEFDFDGTLDDFDKSKNDVKKNIAVAAGVSIDDIISMTAVVGPSGKVRVTTVIRAPRSREVTLCDGLKSDGALQAIKFVACSVDGGAQPETTPLPNAGGFVITPIIIAAIAAGGAGVVLGVSAGVYSLVRVRNVRTKIIDSGEPKALTGLSIAADEPNLPRVTNAWADEFGEVDPGGVFMQYKRNPVLQNPFLAADGYVNPGQNFRPTSSNDVSVEDYQEDF